MGECRHFDLPTGQPWRDSVVFLCLSLLFLFSFQEMAEYDIPAMLEHALKVSGQSQLFYIGHSQGTLIGFSEFSANPELAKKVKLFIALAPIFYLSHTAAILRDLAFTLKPIEVWACTIGLI